jgi:hypothetical protein
MIKTHNAALCIFTLNTIANTTTTVPTIVCTTTTTTTTTTIIIFGLFNEILDSEELLAKDYLQI